MNYFQQLGDRFLGNTTQEIMPRTQMRYEDARPAQDDFSEEMASVESSNQTQMPGSSPDKISTGNLTDPADRASASNDVAPTVQQYITNENNSYYSETAQAAPTENPSTDLGQKIRQVEQRLDGFERNAGGESPGEPPSFESSYFSQVNLVQQSHEHEGDEINQFIDQSQAITNATEIRNQTQVNNVNNASISNNLAVEKSEHKNSFVAVNESIHLQSISNSVLNRLENQEHHHYSNNPDSSPRTFPRTAAPPEIVVDSLIVEQPETVTVSIGRIEIRPTREQSPTQPRQAAPQARVMSLEEYLHQNGGVQ